MNDKLLKKVSTWRAKSRRWFVLILLMLLLGVTIVLLIAILGGTKFVGVIVPNIGDIIHFLLGWKGIILLGFIFIAGGNWLTRN